MSNNQNIQLPRSLFNNIMIFVEFLKISEQSFPCFLKFDEIYLGLREKQHSINKRTAYTDIIYSSGDKRAEAQRNYQMLKNKK